MYPEIEVTEDGGYDRWLGTDKDACVSISENGNLLCKGKRFLYGHGIYSTPDIHVAERFAQEPMLKGEKICHGIPELSKSWHFQRFRATNIGLPKAMRNLY
ncbi:hypothetical protein C2G38_2238284 [Gigaspora rosea]|uniref:Uncharacterized protein n=1 Tax=Gigaspora rosea TaxID=44941 RepID=A0A397W7T8_9GLOM|nr:hypothetical protein C2G38_2238284 [Gigaspora rosea]